MQGFTLKATTSTYAHPESAARVPGQPGSSRVPDRPESAFNGKRVSNNRRRTVTTRVDAKHVEDAFWKKRPLQGRHITPTGVLIAYGHDATSLRRGFFLQKLCLQHILLGNRKVTPDQVVQEFNRQPDRKNKCKLAKARFKAECCLRGLPLNGQLVTTDAVVKDYRAANARLELARFKAECCLRGLLLSGRQVTPDAVVKDCQAARAMLELARFREQCCLNGLPINGHEVTPDAVFKGFPDSPDGRLAIARFKAECCLKGLRLHGRQVTPDMVVKDFQAAGAIHELARFKEHCCLSGLPINGQQVTGDEVIKDYQAARVTLDPARFKAECCLRNLLLNGQLVTPDEVARDYQAARAKLELARFKAECSLRGLPLNGQKVMADAVVKSFPDSPAGKLGIARFTEQCCLSGVELNGQQVSPETVARNYQATRSTLALARFKAECSLRGWVLKGQLVPPEAVVRDFQAARAILELARFKETCCLKGQAINGQQVTPDEVANDYQSVNAALELARFRAECYLRGLSLNGQQVTTEAVITGYPDSPEGKLGIIRFNEECCLRGLSLNGQQVTPEAVVKGYQAIKATLELARFKAECCLRGLPINNQQVSPDVVVRIYQATRATLELGRFKADCCLRGLPLNGQQVTPDAVVHAFPDNPKGKLAIARFMADCCLRGLLLNGHQVSADSVVREFRGIPEGTLGIARFKVECCLRGLLLNDLPVTPDAVVNAFPDSPEGKLGIARFKAECCLRSLRLNSQQVTPDAVVSAFPNGPEGKLGIARFKAECCLRYLRLNGRQVTPDSVVRDYELGGWLLEKAMFYAHLALGARVLNGNYLDSRKVLEAFDEATGNHSSRQTRYLIQQLKQARQYDETGEAQDIIHKASQILDNVSVKDDEQHRLQCILKFTAMQHGLSVNHRKVSAEQVLRSINILRSSFQNSRIHFFFLTYCHINKQSIAGQEVHKNQVLESLKNFPEGSKLRHALGCWFEQCSSEANIIDKLLFHRPNTPGHGHHLPDVIPETGSAGRSTKPVVRSVANHPVKEALLLCQAREYTRETENTAFTQAVAARAAQILKPSPETGFLQNQVPWLNALTLKTLEIIQEINGLFPSPPILINGSFSRFLQNLCSFFNDIDIICTTEKHARILFARLQALNTAEDSEIPKSIIIWPIEGCHRIQLPKAYNIHLKDGDLGMKAMELQVSIDARVAHGNAAPLAIHVPGVGKPVWCLSFTEETRLMNDTLKYFADNLDPLTDQLKKGRVFHIPRTILFNVPQNLDECIYGLFMRSLLTLNKARKFIALYAQGKTGKPGQHQKENQCLYELAASLQMKLRRHSYHHGFVHRVNGWLSSTQPVNDYQLKRKDFIKTLLAMVRPE
ncbi:hypothetical protein [Endozoicomonas sp. SESOKO1]|uniref:hypothetical protein n=1 Tax=Endozoicomonas sp. SESOKO1 TaxID=2828742 RepID=UPI0021478004|nr:hypothetical protein [Endozoicomonas sp. SESOKO1]